MAFEAQDVKTALLSVKKVSLGVPLQRGRAQVMFLDPNVATHSHAVGTHGSGWRTAHASSIDVKGVIVLYYILKATSAPPREGTIGKKVVPFFLQIFALIFGLVLLG